MIKLSYSLFDIMLPRIYWNFSFNFTMHKWLFVTYGFPNSIRICPIDKFSYGLLFLLLWQKYMILPRSNKLKGIILFFLNNKFSCVLPL